MKWQITITNHAEQARNDRAYWRERSAEERLDAVETLRIEAGKFLYEYPSRLRRVVEIKSATPRAKDKGDVEELTGK
jgi:hypothetical protein